jgi:hypothetical protein
MYNAAELSVKYSYQSVRNRERRGRLVVFDSEVAAQVEVNRWCYWGDIRWIGEGPGCSRIEDRRIE